MSIKLFTYTNNIVKRKNLVFKKSSFKNITTTNFDFNYIKISKILS